MKPPREWPDPPPDRTTQLVFRYPSPPFVIHKWVGDTKFSIHLQKAPVWSCLVETPWSEKMLAVLFPDGADWHLNFYSVRGENKYVFLNDLPVETPDEKKDQPRSAKGRIEALLGSATVDIENLLKKAWEAVLQKAFAELSYPEVSDGTDHFHVFENEEEARSYVSTISVVSEDGPDTDSVH